MDGVPDNPGQECRFGVHMHVNNSGSDKPKDTNHEGDDSAIKEKVSLKLKECSTCCDTFEESDLVKCIASSECKYTQCTQCIVKGGGWVCPAPECMYLHFKCPACRQIGGSPKLTLNDDRFTKKDVLNVLSTVRTLFNEMQMERERERERELDEIMGDFTRKMSLFANGIHVLERQEEE